MPASIHKEFEEQSELGLKFIELWNKQDRDGAQNVMADKFKISIPSVYRIRKKLGLELLHSPEHPGKKKLFKRIKRLYYKMESTAAVARAVGMSSQGVNQILVKQGVEIGQPWIKNILLAPPHNGMTITRFNAALKDMAENQGMNAAQIAKALKADHNSVCRKLTAMGILLNQNHRMADGNYPCEWCGKIMHKVWIVKGKRKQRYCCGPCKSKTKDYRRFMNADKKIKQLEAELKSTWGDAWEKQARKLLKPANKGCSRKAVSTDI